MINKINCLTYCRRFEEIENYQAAISDVTQTWSCHHRLETHFSDGTARSELLSKEELQALDMYYDRPPEEFVFLTRRDHTQTKNGIQMGKSLVSFLLVNNQTDGG